MTIIYCSDPFNTGKVDTFFEDEYNAARDLGFTVELVNYDELTYFENTAKSLRRIKPFASKEAAIYRGWILKPKFYEILYESLKAKNVELINSPRSYKHCLYLPESYDLIEENTPMTVWLKKEDIADSFDKIHELIKVFGDSPIVIKDFVESRKHYWYEACYIPNASDFNKVDSVVNKFLELLGAELNEGILFREFVKLEFLSYHPKSGMPLSKEFRVFFFDGEPLQIFRYWDEGDYGDIEPDLSAFLDVAKRIQSRFFTMDIAKVENGGWIIIELGDGQVSGLPLNADLFEFYGNIKERANKPSRIIFV